MMIGREQSAPELISELLDVQKSALLRGDIAQLGKIEDPLKHAFERLRSESTPMQTLARIKNAAARNAALLTAARAGIAVARGQIIARQSQDLSVYDANGKSVQTTPGPTRLLSRR